MSSELFGRNDWRSWRNEGAEDVGPFELIQVTDGQQINNRQTTLGILPIMPAGKLYVVNGPQVVKKDEYGLYQPNGTEVLVIYDEGEGESYYGQPMFGDIYGPKGSQGSAVKGGAPGVLIAIAVVDADKKLMRANLGITAQSPIRWYFGTTKAAVHAEDNLYYVEDLMAIDGGSVPDPDGEDDDWVVQNGSGVGAGHSIDAETTILIMEFYFGGVMRRAIDPPCPVPVS